MSNETLEQMEARHKEERAALQAKKRLQREKENAIVGAYIRKNDSTKFDETLSKIADEKERNRLARAAKQNEKTDEPEAVEEKQETESAPVTASPANVFDRVSNRREEYRGTHSNV